MTFLMSCFYFSGDHKLFLLTLGPRCGLGCTTNMYGHTHVAHTCYLGEGSICVCLSFRYLNFLFFLKEQSSLLKDLGSGKDVLRVDRSINLFSSGFLGT